MSRNQERLKLSSRLSAMTLRSVGKLDPPPVGDDIKQCKSERYFIKMEFNFIVKLETIFKIKYHLVEDTCFAFNITMPTNEILNLILHTGI